MASNEEAMPILEVMRLAPSSNSPTSSKSHGSPTPGSPLTTTLNTTTTVHYSMPISALSTQVETPTLPTSTSSALPPQPSSPFTSFSLITTLQPYSPHRNTNPFNNTPSSTRPRPSTIHNSTYILNTLFSPAKCDRFFVIPPTDPYSDNTYLLQQYLQEQVGRVPFLTRPDRSRLVTVISKTEAIALSNLISLAIRFLQNLIQLLILVLELSLSPQQAAL